MSSRYVVQFGDTWDVITRKQYGAEERAVDIRRANPGQPDEPLIGTTIIIPDRFSDLSPDTIAAENSDDVAIIIEGVEYMDWLTVNMSRSIDSLSSATFTVPLVVEEVRTIFTPLSFKTVDIYVGGEKLFRGVMVMVDPLLTVDAKTISISCYSSPGVLQRCTLPSSAYPLQFVESPDLKQVADQVCKPFGIRVKQDTDVGAAFDQVTCGQTTPLFSFIAGLARQRGVMLSDNPAGDLLIRTAIDDSEPVAKLEQGFVPLLSVVPSFDPESFYTHITAIGDLVGGTPDDASHVSTENSLQTNAFRPFAYTVADTSGARVKKAADAEYGRMMANVVKYTISVIGWRTPDGDLWQPNTILEVLAPDAFIFTSYKLIIRDVEFNRNENSLTTTLKVTLPGVLNGEAPRRTQVPLRDVDSIVYPWE